MKPPLLRIKNLSCHYTGQPNNRIPAINAINLDIYPGETVGLIGDNASGKTTFGKALIGILTKTAGSVSYRNKTLPKKYRPVDFKRYASQIQMIFQNSGASFNAHKTVLAVLREPLLLQQKSKGLLADKKLITEWLEIAGLGTKQLSDHIYHFSASQKQQLAIARALIIKPKLIICDELPANFSVPVQIKLMNLLMTLKKSLNLTCLFLSRDIAMTQYVSDRIAVLHNGFLIESGPSDSIISKPKHPYTQLLVASSFYNCSNKIRQSNIRSLLTRGNTNCPITSGCQFHQNCPEALNQCSKSIPKLENKKDRLIACHLYD